MSWLASWLIRSWRSRLCWQSLTNEKSPNRVLFQSLASRYKLASEVVPSQICCNADEAIASRVAQPEWQGAIDALIEHMREGRIADGFVEAIERCGGVLATHFPAKPDERSELPDRIYLI
jgi:uncharacterized membrane protein